MNTGIQDAHNLAWKIAFLLKGVAPSSILATYETERKPVLLQPSQLLFSFYFVLSVLILYFHVYSFVRLLFLIQLLAFRTLEQQWQFLQLLVSIQVSQIQVNCCRHSSENPTVLFLLTFDFKPCEGRYSILISW